MADKLVKLKNINSMYQSYQDAWYAPGDGPEVTESEATRLVKEYKHIWKRESSKKGGDE